MRVVLTEKCVLDKTLSTMQIFAAPISMAAKYFITIGRTSSKLQNNGLMVLQ